jgi:hypothetical protein
MSIDILGEYPQVMGYYYKDGSDYQNLPQDASTPLTFSGVVTEINTHQSAGNTLIVVEKPGIYLVDASIHYSSTPNGFTTFLDLYVNTSRFCSSAYEAQVENISLTLIRLTTFTDYIPADSTIGLNLWTNAPGPMEAKVGHYSSYLKMVRLR